MKKPLDDESKIRDGIETWLEGVNGLIVFCERAVALGDRPTATNGINALERKIRTIKEVRKIYDDNVKTEKQRFFKLDRFYKNKYHIGNNASFVEKDDYHEIYPQYLYPHILNKFSIIQMSLDDADLILKRVDGDIRGV